MQSPRQSTQERREDVLSIAIIKAQNAPSSRFNNIEI